MRGPVVPTAVIQKCDVGVQSEKEEPSTWEFSDHPTVKAVSAKPLLPPVQLCPLQFVTVDVAGYVCTALNDSGCQIPVVSERKFGWCKDGAVGTVNLHGFGRDHVVQAPLVRLTVRLCSENECVNDGGDGCTEQAAIPLVCAVADIGATDYDVLLPSSVVHELAACNSSVRCVSVDTGECTSVCAQGVEECVQDHSETAVESVSPDTVRSETAVETLGPDPVWSETADQDDHRASSLPCDEPGEESESQPDDCRETRQAAAASWSLGEQLVWSDGGSSRLPVIVVLGVLMLLMTVAVAMSASMLRTQRQLHCDRSIDCDDELYKWVRRPCGVENAGATFIRAVRSALRPICSVADWYIDDMSSDPTPI